MRAHATRLPAACRLAPHHIAIARSCRALLASGNGAHDMVLGAVPITGDAALWRATPGY